MVINNNTPFGVFNERKCIFTEVEDYMSYTHSLHGATIKVKYLQGGGNRISSFIRHIKEIPKAHLFSDLFLFDVLINYSSR